MSECEERPVVIVVLDEGLPASAVSCSRCGGSFTPWGHGRVRSIRLRGGGRLEMRPRRVRCGGCRITHVLLPAAVVPRRADPIETIGAALLAKAGGRGHRQIAAELGVPAATVRGWLRRATGRAEWLRVEATRFAQLADPLLDAPAPTGTVFGDAVEALGRAAAAAIRRLGPIAAPWPLVAVIAHGMLLAPLRS